MVEIKLGSVITTFFVLIIIGMLISGVAYTIKAGQRGVILTFGKANPYSMEEGLHFKVPLAQEIIKMDITTQKYETDASAASKDLQIVSTKIAVNYHLSPESVAMIYSESSLDYSNRLINPAVQETVKATTAQYSAEELVTRRDNVKEGILQSLKDRLTKRNILVEDISITDFDFSPEFNKAIEAKVTAEQMAFQASNDLKRIEVEKLQKITQAEGEAQAVKTKAEAEAYSIELIRNQLEKSTNLVQYKMIEKWDGKLPMYSLGQSMPLINLPTYEQK